MPAFFIFLSSTLRCFAFIPGAFTVIFAEVFLNAPLLTVFNAEPFSSVMLFNLILPLNACLPIVFTFLPIVALASFLYPLNALSPICTTLHLTPLIVTCFCITRLAMFLFLPFVAIAVFFAGSATV